jgi:hypothetical protein
MREDYKYGQRYGRRFFVGIDIALVAMVVYAFNAECYSSEEVNTFSEDTCKSLAKHDSKNVHIYEYETKNIDNICNAINREGKIVFVRAFEK